MSLLGDKEMENDLSLKAQRAEQTVRVLYNRLYSVQSIATSIIQQSVDLEGLGQWQKPILDIVKTELPGSRPSYVPLPNGHTGLVVSWTGFSDYDEDKRQAKVLSIVAKLGNDAVKLINMVVARTPEEMSHPLEG